MSSSIVKDINDLIKEYHNPSLVKPEESPNGNTIYHIYSNGQITSQKGGFAYLQRSEFVNFNSIKNFKLKKLISCPLNNSDNEYYAIVEQKYAIEIRNLMLTYI